MTCIWNVVVLMCHGVVLNLAKNKPNIHYFRCFCQSAHCWRIPIPMTRLCLKLHICTRLTGPSMKPPHAAGHRSTPWGDQLFLLSC